MARINKDAALDVLSHLLATLTSPPAGLERFKGLFPQDLDFKIPEESVKAVREVLFSCMREPILELFSGPHVPSYKAIRTPALSGQQHIHGEADKGVYMHMIHGRDEKWRLYVGQSLQLRVRIKYQHQDFRYRRDNSSLHTKAMQDSKWDHFVIFAVLPKTLPAGLDTDDKRALLLSVLEMWCALLFETLQPQDLAKWCPPTHQPPSQPLWFGLNMRLPIDHSGDVERKAGVSWTKHWAAVLESSLDPLAQEYREVDLLGGPPRGKDGEIIPSTAATATAKPQVVWRTRKVQEQVFVPTSPGLLFLVFVGGFCLGAFIMGGHSSPRSPPKRWR